MLLIQFMKLHPSRHNYTPLICNSFHLQFISFAIHLARLPKPIKIFKRLKNRENNSKFDDFWTKRIVSARPISGKIFETTKRQKCFSKTFCSFRSFEFFSRSRWRRDGWFVPKIAEFRAILAIFRPFEDGNQTLSLY